jgi:hypothetical protein
MGASFACQFPDELDYIFILLNAGRSCWSLRKSFFPPVVSTPSKKWFLAWLGIACNSMVRFHRIHPIFILLLLINVTY